MISVVVPTCHRNDLLALCLERLAPGKQTLDAAMYEVIVTDDGRVATAENMIAQEYPWARWVVGPKDGPAANRNNGARQARGEWIAFTDDDCLPEPQWLEAILKAAREEKVDVVEGRTTIPDFTDDPFLQGVRNEVGGCFWSCNLAVRRSVFEALGGFDEDFKEAADEDIEFAWRFRARGHAHRFVREALVLHPVRALSWGSVWKRTKMHRWHQLLSFKRGDADPRENVAAGSARAIGKYCMATVRTTWHMLSKPSPGEWRTRLFWQSVRWATLPYVLPYIAVWRHRFARMLRERSEAKTSVGGNVSLAPR